MTHDLHLQVTEVNIVEEPTAIFSRNFVLFVFFVAKSSTCKCCNSAFGVQSTSLPGTEADPRCAITVRNRVPRGTMRLRCGMGFLEVPCDYGAELRAVLCGNIMVRNCTWFRGVRSWCGL